MEAINRLLINLGNAAQWLWDVIASFCVGVWGGLDALLNPIMSPVLAFLNPVCTRIGDAVYAVLAPLPAWVGITLISGVAGVVMLIAFRYTSNQAAIGRARDDITANLLALKLFKDDILVGFRAQGRLLTALGRLQWHMLRPVLIMILPMLLVMAQMGMRYQWRPLRLGEQTLIKLQLASEGDETPEVRLEPDSALEVEAGPIPGGGELVWRVRGNEPGRHTLHFDIDGQRVDKEVVVGEGLQRVSAERCGPRWTSQILHPCEPRLPGDGPVRSVEIAYGEIDSWVYGSNWWILYFFVVSMLLALIFKPVFKVRF